MGKYWELEIYKCKGCLNDKTRGNNSCLKFTIKQQSIWDKYIKWSKWSCIKQLKNQFSEYALGKG